ncbi:MAG TPA: hypothetical protein VFI47_03035 [Acidimicrobiales bacterium]|nr:hypothetical protein [Acidimicrobiales bacterium]
MTAPTRLGDLVRVVHALQPDAHELALIGELLADYDAPPARVLAQPRRHPPDDAPAPPLDTGRPPRPPPPHGPLRRRIRDVSPRARSLLGEQAPRERAWWTTVGALVVVLALLRATGRIGGSGWLVVAVGLVAARPLLNDWSMWWHSAQRHSSAEHEDPQSGAGGDEPDRGGVALNRVRWQPPPPGVPLVRKGQQRAIATLLAGRPVPGDVDLVATVRQLATRRPLTAIPRRPRWSTSRGVHLHVDRGPALEPFRYDVAQLRRSLASIASPHAVVELGFDGDPAAVTWPRRIVGPGGRAPLASRLPPPGTPVLVLTDLGISVPRTGTPPEAHDFLDHHRLLTGAGCSVHYLVPYPPERWPETLWPLPILYWSDDLGAVEVLAGIRRRLQAT